MCKALGLTCRMETFARHGMSCNNTVSMVDSLVLRLRIHDKFECLLRTCFLGTRDEDSGLSTLR